MDYQWYPGHMTRARRQMQEDMKLIDLVIELIDARAPMSTRNPDIDVLARGKGRLVLMNKSDLADERKTQAWLENLQKDGLQAACINARDKQALKHLQSLVRKACAKKLERDQRRGIQNRPIRAMVVGIPNVGKSTLINSVAGKSAARTGDKPGVTKGKQWIRLAKDLEFLDTPGILWPKFEDQQVGMRLAMIGSIRDEILNQEELACSLLCYLKDHYESLLTGRYFPQDPQALDLFWGQGAEEMTGALLALGEIARRRGAIKKGAEPDTERAAALVLEDFRSGRIGRICLESAPVIGEEEA